MFYLLDQGAHLEFTMIQNETVNGFHHLNNHIVYQNRDSQFKQTAVSLAGRLLRNQVFVRLQEPEQTAPFKVCIMAKETTM